jgi:hypothetical protein
MSKLNIKIYTTNRQIHWSYKENNEMRMNIIAGSKYLPEIDISMYDEVRFGSETIEHPYELSNNRAISIAISVIKPMQSK